MTARLDFRHYAAVGNRSGIWCTGWLERRGGHGGAATPTGRESRRSAISMPRDDRAASARQRVAAIAVRLGRRRPRLRPVAGRRTPRPRALRPLSRSKLVGVRFHIRSIARGSTLRQNAVRLRTGSNGRLLILHAQDELLDLPTLIFGSPPNATAFGALKWARRSRTKAIMSRMLARLPLPHRSTKVFGV